MSRWIETDFTTQGRRYYTEKLDNPDRCRWLTNEVCCNGDNIDMRGDFPNQSRCVEGGCPYFEPEPPDELEKLRKGKVSYD